MRERNGNEGIGGDWCVLEFFLGGGVNEEEGLRGKAMKKLRCFVSAQNWADCEGKQQNDKLYRFFIFILELHIIDYLSSFSQVLPSHRIFFLFILT